MTECEWMVHLRISASVKPSTLFLRALGRPRFFGFLSSSLSSVSLSEPDVRCFCFEASLSLSLARAWREPTWERKIFAPCSGWANVPPTHVPACLNFCFWAAWRCPPFPSASPLLLFCVADLRGWCCPIRARPFPPARECSLPWWRSLLPAPINTDLFKRV